MSKNNVDAIVESICYILDNNLTTQDYDNLEEAKKSIVDVVSGVLHSNNTEDNINNTTEYLGAKVFIVDAGGIQSKEKNQKEKVSDKLQEMLKNKTDDHYFFILVNNLTSKCVVERMVRTLRVRSSKIHIIGYRNYKNKELKLKNINRFDCIYMPTLASRYKQEHGNTEPLSGFVCTVDLVELVELYNEVGDELFKKNLRYGLKDNLGVDLAITNTLKNEPEKFWYKNNGITIITENPDFVLDRVSEICFENASNVGELQFSVVNGAQTITAAARFFYEDIDATSSSAEYTTTDQKNAKDIRDNARVNAKVLLRIICVKKDSLAPATSGEISVALNRQKPIKAEDIAYSTSTVTHILEIIRTHNPRYTLVKRGDSANYGIDTMDLGSFARAQKASMMNPGEARSNSLSKLLAVTFDENNEQLYLKDSAFLSPGNETSSTTNQYNGVLFAHKVQELYKRKHKILANRFKKEGDERKATVISNGKWYFVSLVIAYLIYFNNNKSLSKLASGKHNLKEFRYNPNVIKYLDKNIDLVMEDFADFVTNALPKDTNMDSNSFKSNDAFKKLLSKNIFANIPSSIKDLASAGAESSAKLYLEEKTEE